MKNEKCAGNIFNWGALQTKINLAFWLFNVAAIFSFHIKSVTKILLFLSICFIGHESMAKSPFHMPWQDLLMWDACAAGRGTSPQHHRWMTHSRIFSIRNWCVFSAQQTLSFKYGFARMSNFLLKETLHRKSGRTRGIHLAIPHTKMVNFNRRIILRKTEKRQAFLANVTHENTSTSHSRQFFRNVCFSISLQSSSDFRLLTAI